MCLYYARDFDYTMLLALNEIAYAKAKIMEHTKEEY